VRRLHLATAGAFALLVATSPARARADERSDSGAVLPPLPPGTAARAASPEPLYKFDDRTLPADPDELFADAMKLVEREQYEAAIPLLEEAQRLDPGVGTQFNLAVCYAKAGRLALAWKNFRQVEALADAAGKKARTAAARAQLEELRPRLRTLVVHLREAPGSVTVSVDGEIVPPSQLLFIPLDPGEHKVEAYAPGKKPFVELVVVSAAEGERHVVGVRELEPLETRTEIRTVTEETTDTRRTLGYVFGGVGLAGAATAAVTGILILSDKSTASDRCKPNCVTATGEVDAIGADAVQRGKTLMPINIVAWVVAGAGLGAGAFFLATSRKQPAAATTVLPSFDARGGASAVLSTTF
jgi:hypothetical protein